MKSISIVLLLSGLSLVTHAQIDDEFWFVVPELSHRGTTGGTPGTMRIATMELDATVTISMPANAYNPITNPNGFKDTVFTIPGNSAVGIDLSFLIDVAANPTNNRLENKPLTVSGINNFGLHITATNMITAYWEVNYDLGSDLWTLKGGNALGTLFYTPFQTVYPNRIITPKAYSAIDVVSTRNNNQVTFTLPPGIAASYGSIPTTTAPGATFSVTLNRGQTFSLFPQNYSVAPGDRLAGTKVSATDSIAVTVKDDAIATPPNGQDVVGDQLVPVDIVGDQYIVPEVGNPNHVYVIATQDNTTIYAYYPDNTPLPGSPFGPLNAGQQLLITVPGGSKLARLTSKLNPGDPSRPFYVFQLGTENKSRGGAIIPAIGCTGNTQLAFTRARDDNKFYFFIIVEKGNEDKFFIDGVPQDGSVTPQIIDPGQFIDVTGSGGYVAWFSGSINSNVLTPGQHLVQNTGGIFHLGIMNGFPGQGLLYYGYYSDFGGLNIGATVAGTNSSVVRACFGNPVQLYAFGGTNYSWTPDAYLDDATSNMPTAYNLPPGTHFYTVDVSGACASGSVDLTVLVAPPVDAHFVTNVASGCSPLEIEIKDQSTGVYSWQYDLGDGSPLIKYDLNPITPDPPPPGYPAPFTITNTYDNVTDSALTWNINLLVKNSSGCSDILDKTIVAFPEIHSGFSVAGGTDDGCDPLPVQFQNSSTGNTDTWLWEFGDGGSSIEENPLHIFRNQFGPDNLVFDTRLISISQYDCRDTSLHTITVRPYIEAKFAFDTVRGCSPREIRITDESIQADFYSWDFGDGTTSNSPGPEILKTFVNPLPVSDTFTVTLRVDNEEGCFDVMERDLVIFPELQASFAAGPVEGCSPVEISFQNFSTGAAEYFWDFGDGGTSTQANPVHLYDRNMSDNDTVYRVSMVATSTELCRDTMWFDVVIHPYIEAAFTVDDVVGCHPFTVTINNQSIGADQFSWNFGDGTPVSSTSVANFTHIYQNTGGTTVVYPLRLIVRNTQGCSDTLIRNITVHPVMTSSFTADAFQGCNPLNVSFTDLSVNAAEYYWDFGDGASSLLAEPSHTFTNFGTVDSIYLVNLTTYSSDGECIKSFSRSITVHPNVEAEFSFPAALDCGPFDVSFENLSIGGTSFTWDFDDGTVTTVGNTNPVSHTFINNDFVIIRDFEVTLVAENDAGCSSEARKTIRVYPDVAADFDPVSPEGCHPLNVLFTNLSNGAQTFVWSFGDGTGSSLQNPMHTFENTGTVDSIYTVRLISIAPNNVCRDTIKTDVTVHPYVKANFTTTMHQGCNPFDVVLENSSVNASLYRWDFGDGSDTVTNNLNPITHRFFNADFSSRKDYEITLVAESSAGCTNEFKSVVTVEPDIAADFTASMDSGCHPFSVNFTNLSSGASYFVWDFDNGNTSQAVSPSQTFSNIGSADTTYHVWLHTYASNHVCRDSLELDIVVHPYVNADFGIQYLQQCPPAAVVITNSSTNGQQYSWTFNGDPLVTGSMAPIYRQFDNASTVSAAYYPVDLTVTSPQGCTSSLSRQVKVYHSIEADFASITEGCQPLEVTFMNSSLGALNHRWEFGDNTSSVIEDPVHIYTNESNVDSVFTVKLLTISENLCRDSLYDQITVHPVPKAKFVVDKTFDCSPLNINIDNISEAGNNFAWTFGDGSVPFVTTDMLPLSYTYTNDLGNLQMFVLRLDVTTDYGCSDYITQNLTVYSSVWADFELDSAGCSPHTTQFINNSQRASNYTWDFGDGVNSNVQSPGHTFVNNGSIDTVFNIELRSYSGYGCQDSITRQVTVYPSPEARFSYSPIYQYFPGSSVSLLNESNDGPWDFAWDFDDGNTSTQKDPLSHIYTGWGEYDIMLKVQSDHCSDSVVHWIKIFPPLPVADFTADIDTGCMPLTVRFTNNSLYGEEYYWEFDDGGTSNAFEPTHTYNKSGYFQVKLTVRGEGGEDFAFHEIRVFILPEPDFVVEPSLVMLPDQPVRAFNFTKYGDRYLWDFGDGTTNYAKDTAHQYTETGVYDVSLRAWTEHGCEAFLIVPEAVTVEGKGMIMFPNVFAPDNSGPNGGWYNPNSPTNNVFYPAVREGVVKYNLIIYNRWGELVFESDDVNKGWDGYCGSERCMEAVYIWKVTVEYTNGKKEILVGDVTLLHRKSGQ